MASKKNLREEIESLKKQKEKCQSEIGSLREDIATIHLTEMCDYSLARHNIRTKLSRIMRDRKIEKKNIPFSKVFKIKFNANGDII